jgi:hypothetical protein
MVARGGDRRQRVDAGGPGDAVVAHRHDQGVLVPAGLRAQRLVHLSRWW